MTFKRFACDKIEGKLIRGKCFCKTTDGIVRAGRQQQIGNVHNPEQAIGIKRCCNSGGNRCGYEKGAGSIPKADQVRFGQSAAVSKAVEIAQRRDHDASRGNNVEAVSSR